jgi:hypothetical protein
VHGDVFCVFNFSAVPQRLRMPRGEWDPALRSDMPEPKVAHEVPARATLVYKRRA